MFKSLAKCQAVRGLLPSLLLFALATGGCSTYIDPNVPEPIQPHKDPVLNRPYLLYKPSSYDRQHDWPLVVVCHGAFPDSANEHIREWTELAEEKGFLLVAPNLDSSDRSLFGDYEKIATKLRADEEHVLSAVQHVTAGYRISGDRIMIAGWAQGARAALHVGLRHPHLFRAIAVDQPKLEPTMLAEASRAIDRHQPVYVHYSVNDAVVGSDARRLIEWLQSQRANLTYDTVGIAVGPDTRQAIEFFERVIRREPWVFIRAFAAEGGDPLEVQFKLSSNRPVSRYDWSFGDGITSPVATPTHRYATPGTYAIRVEFELQNGKTQTRAISFTVPQGLISPPTGRREM